MKKKVLAIMLSAAMVMGMAGCGSSEKEKETANKADTETTQEEDGEQVVLKYTGWGSPAEKKTTQKVIDNFEKTHPNVKVDYVHIPTGDYQTKLTTMIAAGQSPDVALLNGDTALQWATQGKLMNMMEMAENDPEFDLNAIMPQTVYWWDEGKACGVNGALEVFGLMYNKDVLKEAGITVPTTEEEAWTWDEFVEVAQKLTIDRNGKNALDPDFDPKNIQQFGLYIPGGANMLSYAMAYAQQDFLTEDGTKVDLAGTKAEEAVQNFADLINKYHVAPNPAQSKNLPGGSTALASKKVAMVWDGQWAFLVWGECAAATMYDRKSVNRTLKDWSEIVERDYNHPCIVTWVPINESWGVPGIQRDKMQQSFSETMYHYLHAVDNTRLVISNDGWSMTATDICAIHNYSHGQKDETEKYEEYKEMLSTTESLIEQPPTCWDIYAQGYGHQRAPILLTEFGGIGFEVSEQKGWGYSSVNSEKEFLEDYGRIMDAVYASKGLWGYCYTQLTDVEQEINGLVTYDRKPKCDLVEIKKINDRYHVSRIG